MTTMSIVSTATEWMVWLVADQAELKRLKETYTHQLQELNKSKPKDSGDEDLLQDLARLDAQLGVAKDDLVRLEADAFRRSV